MKREVKIGDLIKFDWIYNSCRLNERIAIYLGEDIILRDDGVRIENHKIQLLGDAHTTTIDKGLMYSLSKYNG